MSPATAGRVYRALLRLAPRRLRERNAAEMEELFLERWSEARPGVRTFRVWAFALGDLVAARVRGAVAPHDPAVIGGALLLLGMAALAASWLPAARAARLDPMATLRAE